MPFGLFFLFAFLRRPVFGGRDAETGHRLTARCDAHFGILAEVAHQDHLVHAAHVTASFSLLVALRSLSSWFLLFVIRYSLFPFGLPRFNRSTCCLASRAMSVSGNCFITVSSDSRARSTWPSSPSTMPRL